MSDMPNTDRKRSDWDTIRRLLGYFEGETALLLGLALMLIMSAVGQAVSPALIGQAIDQYISQDDRAGLTQTMLLLLGVYLIGYIGFAGQLRLLGTLSQKLLKRLRADIFGHVQRLSLGYFQKHGAGDLMSRLVNDTDVIGTLFSQTLMQSLGSLVGLVGIIIAMFALNVPLSLSTVIILPVMILTTIYFSRRSRVAFQETRRTLGQLSTDLEENLSTVRESQSFARTNINIAQFDRDNAANRDANIYATSITAAFSPTMDVLSTLGTVLVAGVGGWLAFNDTITVGVVVAFLAYVQRFFQPVQQLSSLYTQMQAAFAAGDRVFDLLETVPEIIDKTDAVELPAMTGRVEFNDVAFGYDDSQVILNGVSLQAEVGQTIALIGETGSGKSTIVNLIGRFYDVNTGQVLVDGYDVRDVTQYSLRQHMSEVPQNSFLFADTIVSNIRYGKPEASFEEVEAAAKAARAHDFIVDLPEGYETKLAMEGASISQGQRQLLCIARAILANPRLLILDEATSNIDTRTERLVQEAIDNLLQDRTAFVIAHRLSTIRHADQIVVIGDGQILEQGSHDELIGQDGFYARLYHKQQV